MKFVEIPVDIQAQTIDAEAVIFAEEFGLTAKDMNRSFIIPSRSGGHRDLNLAGDTPTNAKELYSIWKSILKYRDLQYSSV